MGRLHQTILATLSRRIEDGTYRVGQRLPAERVIAADLKVSRPVVREAIRVLSSRGVLYSDSTRGTFVSHAVTALRPDFATDESPSRLTFRELVEGRMMLEVKIAEVAARHADRRAISVLEDRLSWMVSAFPQPADFRRADLAFHNALADATGNRVFAMALQPIVVSLDDASYDLTHLAPVRERILACHSSIFSAVSAGDLPRAEASVTRHVEQFADDIQKGVHFGLLPRHD